MWGTAGLIETDNVETANVPEVAVNANGNAVAVWRQSDGTRTNIWANRYDAIGGSWGTAELIETTNAGDARFPRVSIAPSGDATAVWEQSDGTRFSIWANRYDTAGGNWGTAALIETDDTGDATSARLAVDSNGNVTAVWDQGDGSRLNVWANRYDAAAGTWGTPRLLETDNTGDATGPEVAVDPNGVVMAVWEQFDGIRRNIWANRFQ